LEKEAIMLSSAFPYYKDELFFPKPLNFYPDIEKYEMIKEFKRIRFISSDYLKNILSDNKIDLSSINNEFIINGCLRTKRNDPNKDEIIFKTSEIPHVVIDRLSNSTQIFHKTEVFFSKDSGLFFIANIKDELIPKFEAVLRFLGDEGIGADRTIGKGQFSVSGPVNIDNLSDIRESGYYYLLSLYSPSVDEVNNIDPDKSFYDFSIRQGWISNSTLNRKALRMLTEGSVICLKNVAKLSGEIHNVLSKEENNSEILNSVYRSGQVISLPCRGE